jgi:prevent-host-death family protein
MNTTIPISQFKAHCLEILKRLQAGHGSITITKRSKPIAKVLPLDNQKASLFGMLKGKAEIKGDIIKAIHEQWDAAL